MLLGGDEIGRTQRGNNNAYCQDNEISWYDWSSADTLLEFARRLIQLRKELRRVSRKWFQGRPIHGAKGTTSACSPVRFSTVRWSRSAENVTGDRC